MKQQLRERRMGKQPTWRPVGRDVQAHVKERMLKALDRGEHDEVLKLWEDFVPPLVRRTEKEAQKIEFCEATGVPTPSPPARRRLRHRQRRRCAEELGL